MAQEAPDRIGISIARTVWRWGGGLVGLALTAGARQLIVSSGGPEMPGVILRSVGAVLLVAGGGIVLMWLGYQVWSTCPRQRLRARADLIDAAMEALERDHPERENPGHRGSPTKTRSKTKSLLHQTIHALDKLQVEHPPFGYAVNPWLVFLSRLSAAARVGDLSRAKSIWPEMERERRERDRQDAT